MDTSLRVPRQSGGSITGGQEPAAWRQGSWAPPVSRGCLVRGGGRQAACRGGGGAGLRRAGVSQPGEAQTGKDVVEAMPCTGSMGSPGDDERDRMREAAGVGCGSNCARSVRRRSGLKHISKDRRRNKRGFRE